MNTTIDILKENGLSVTDARTIILDLFIESQGALSHSDIEKSTAENLDRVTIYRTLNLFVDKGLIHTIPTTDNAVQYALCRSSCAEGHHHDDHIHFVCDECDKTICLDNVIVPKVKLPRGFKAHSSSMIISGVCKECS